MLWLYWRRIRLLALSLGAALAAAAVLVLVSVTLGGPSLPASAPRYGGIPPTSPLRRYSVPNAETGRAHRGLMLMKAAAAACQSVSYHGLQMVAWSSAAGADSYLIEVWHRSGQPELSEGDNDVDDRIPSAAASSDAAVSVLTISQRMLTLMRANYVIEYDGAGTSSGRPALVVVIRRPDGSLAARYWLDRQTMLPLRRELLDTSDKVISEDSFTRVRFGALAAAPDADAAQPQSAPQPAWVTAAPPARFLASLSGQGWQLPSGQPGGLPLYATAWTTTGNSKVVDLEYSDGLYVVSLFVQRGSLASSMPGWQPVQLEGQQAYVSGHTVTWAGLGFVYTVIADAPPQTVTQVVGSLPGSGGPPSLLSRLGRGFERLAGLINPFG
jgi:sigma-E factor negative regulatory protein RseB